MRYLAIQLAWITRKASCTLFVLILFLFASPSMAGVDRMAGSDRLFASDRIIAVEIRIGPSELRRLAEEPRNYVSATVRVDGQTVSNAQLRLKGHGSFQPITGKPNLCLKVDEDSKGARPFGHRRLLLNNSAQDPSLIRWKLASELFLNAGLAAARVNSARVALNGRDLGIYVTVEPTDKPFLARHFRSSGGNLYEGSNNDVMDELELDSGDAASQQADLKRLADACQEPDVARRWQRLCATLDVEKFISFMAIEVLICHHDGYALDRNNFRIYHDPGSDRMVFIPHGMDLIFDQPRLPLESSWSGVVARALMETDEGRRLYRRRITELGQLIYGNGALMGRINALSNLIRTSMAENSQSGRSRFEASISSLQRVVLQRTDFVRTCLKAPLTE
jgi:hypothetical protein